ncbi:antitermination protein Q [Yersinia pseudotuberculosis]|uniref:Antitermination protein n=1 Tax=Yersinia pseudotuberculosis serotype O:3 (strain YPIII) TaxID=502800 RepID=A0A0H3B6Q6_YERPY|nr:antitermination protein [Yersinia pseudotuberculosis]AJJ60202.1 antitermination family protein [Yersinia pseudotuberculosis YPIII]MBK1423895.1 hypothetical protein [Yersinia pseudotuberculosis]
MKLESAIKQFSAKSQMITDSPRATSSDSLKGPDMAAAMGMVEARASFGMAAYLGKVGISKEDRIRTVEQLTQFAMKNAPKHVGKASGRRMAQCILVDNVDTTTATQRGGVYLMGQFNQNSVIHDASWTLAELKTALRSYSIFLEDSIQAPV